MPFTFGGDYIPPEKASLKVGPQKSLKIRLEKRKQKTVTIIENLPFNDHELSELLSTLKKKFSCGGTLKDKIITLQGSFETQVKLFLKEGQ